MMTATTLTATIRTTKTVATRRPRRRRTPRAGDGDDVGRKRRRLTREVPLGEGDQDEAGVDDGHRPLGRPHGRLRVGRVARAQRPPHHEQALHGQRRLQPLRRHREHGHEDLVHAAQRLVGLPGRKEDAVRMWPEVIKPIKGHLTKKSVLKAAWCERQ